MASEPRPNRAWTCAALVLAAGGTARADLIFGVAPGGPSGLRTDIVYSPGPVERGGGPNMDLLPEDDINGLSQRQTTTEFLLCFSVDPVTEGTLPPVDGFPPFNVKQQKDFEQAAGDAFISTEVFTRSGSAAAPRPCSAAPIDASVPRSSSPVQGGISVDNPSSTLQGNNVLVINQSDWEGALDFELLPMLPPEEDNTGIDPLDDVDAGATVPPDELPPLYFTLDSGGSLSSSGADIWYDPTPDINTGQAGDTSRYASFADLGLAEGDDIDAMVVYDDDGDGTFMIPGDQVIFSLKAGSPTLDRFGASEADLFTVEPDLDPVIFALHTDIAVAGDGNLDMLELVQLLGTVEETILDKLNLDPCRNCPCPEDINRDGVVDFADLLRILRSWGPCPE